MNLCRAIGVLIILLLVLLLQHIIHEYAHVLIAKVVGVRTIRIQWFTYSKIVLGTKVFFENEPTFNEENLGKKWGWISIAGLMSTLPIGYIFTIIYLIYSKYMDNWLMLVVWLFSVVFLICDPLYFFIGSVLSLGDVVGFRKVFNIKKSVSIIVCLLVLLINWLIIKSFW